MCILERQFTSRLNHKEMRFRVRPILACAVTETNQHLECSKLETRGIILSRRQTTIKGGDQIALIGAADLRICCSHLAQDVPFCDLTHCHCPDSDIE